MKPVRLLLLAFLFGSLSLTACDSGNEKDDDTEVVEEVTETSTETVVAPSAPVVQEINNVVASDFQAVVGTNVVVSTAAGTVTQVATTSTNASGQATTSTTTIAPLVNATTGQPTGQVAVVRQSGTTTTTQVAGLTNANASSLTLGVTSSDGTTTSLPFDASINARAATVQGNNTRDRADTQNYNRMVSADASLTTSIVYANGKTAKQTIQEGLAATKSGAAEAAAAIAKFSTATMNAFNAALNTASLRCSANSSTQTAIVTFYSGKYRLTYQCSTKVVTNIQKL